MPTVSVGRDRLFDALGKTYIQEEFDELCFEFGIELDDVVEEEGEIRYKIEVSANRYDLLCLEGIARSLRIFLGMEAVPVYRCADITSESMIEMHVQPETNLIRPLIVCAVLRGITFNTASYKSFIDLQEKLHQNICRKRTLVAVGTHDLDALQPPFSYEALPASEINFVPLKKERSFRADELFNHYKLSTDQSDMKLKKFLHIIEDSPVYPVIYDSNRTVLSLPPIINGAHSAISERTKNVFIECTATDLTKAKIVLNTMITMFSEYCERKYEVEPVKVLYPDARMSEHDPCEGSHSLTCTYPDLSITKFEAPLSDITGGISLTASEVIPLLKKMQLQACVGENSNLIVSVPPTRSDILHSCDLMEDVAIAFGYNNIPKLKPQSMTQGRRQPLNYFSDKIRTEVSRAGYLEVLTWVLISHEENFAMLKRENDVAKAVTIANPRSSEFQEVRTCLMSGLLNALKHNIDHPRPIKIFEVGDVVTLDEARDVGASNNRRLAALYCNVSSGFEEIAGLVDRIMKVAPKFKADDYTKPSDEPSLFPKRRCDILLKGKKIGIFGIVHPEVLQNFGIRDPCSFMEVDIQALL